jgi:IS1 family transposase
MTETISGQEGKMPMIAVARTFNLKPAIGLLLVFSSNVFGWAGLTHKDLAARVLEDPVVAPFVTEFNVDKNSITSWTSEPPDEWHHPGWAMIRDRGYLGTYNNMDWTSLSETTRLKYLIHIAVDCGVPVGHSPACDVYTSDTYENLLEAQVATWSKSDYPSISGTTAYTHSKSGYSTTFTGTYSEIMTKFYNAQINAATWFKNADKGLLELQSTNASAGWNGTKLGQYLARAMLVDYFLAKRATIAAANGPYTVNPGGSVTLSSSGSQDPDSVTWSSNGTYSNNGGGLSTIAWDLNNDGTYETSGASPTLSYSTVYALTGAGQKTIGLKVVDNEGKAGYATATLTVYANPIASGSATRSYLGKTGEVPAGYDSIQLSGASSYDPDGGSIVSYGWDLNNDGTIDKTGSEILVTYSDFAALNVTASESHKVTLTVTDNEGATATTQVLCAILTNPTCSLKPGYTIYEAHGVEDSVWNFDDGSAQGWYMGGGAGPNSSVSAYMDPISGSYCLDIHDMGYGVSPWAKIDVGGVVQAGATLKFDLKTGVLTSETNLYGSTWSPQWSGHGNVEVIKVALIGPGGTQTLGSLTNVLGFIDASTWYGGQWHTYQMSLADMGIAEGSLITQIVVYLKQNSSWKPTIVRLDNIKITKAVVGSMWKFDDGSTQGWYMSGGAGPNSSVSAYMDPISGSYCLDIHDMGYGVSPWAKIDVGGVVQAGATLKFDLKTGVLTSETNLYGSTWSPQWSGHGNVEVIKVALIGPGGTQTLGSLTNVLGFIDASTWYGGQWHTYQMSLADMGIAEGSLITQIVVYLKQNSSWKPTIVRLDNIEITHIDSLTIAATGSDPDGGTITQWLWDLNNDGVYGEFTGKTLNLTWSELLAYGLTPGSNTVSLKVVDDDGVITGGVWAGTATATTTIVMVESAPLLSGDANLDDQVDVAIWVSLRRTMA